MPLLPEPNECDPDQTITCRAAFAITKDERFSDIASWLIGKPLTVLILVLVAVVARWLLFRVIDRAVSGITSTPLSERRGLRARTMGSLLKSITTGVIFAMVLLTVLDEVGVSVAPLLAGAGIVGVAIGFGAQSLVKDFLSGIFMIFEDQYGVGDVVDLGEASGTIEAVGLRVTRLRDVNGTVWYVRNGEILRVGNMSQNWARTVLDVTVGYTEDLVRVRRVLEEVAHDLWEDEDFKGLVIEEPEVWGVESLGVDGIVVRVTLKTAPMEQWGVARAMRERVKARFEHEGINLAVAQRVMWQESAPSAASAEPTENA
jgi:small conductance mechanosensitive channel